MHISETKTKTAEHLVMMPLDDDPYHQNIKDAARVLYRAGKGRYTYRTQWGSGSTLWDAPSHDPEDTVLVSRLGEIT